MRKRWMCVVAVVAVSAIVSGCGDDDDDEQASGEFCAGYLELNEGDPSPEKIRDVAASAPSEGKAVLERIADGFEEKGEEYFESSEFGENFATIGRIAAEECADSTIEVRASEYKFEGVPATMDAGIVAVDLSNVGKEFHELVVFRRSDDTTKSFDEILALGEEEAEGFLEEKGGTFAEPGSDGAGLFQLDPGDYVAVCFIPVGSTPENEDVEGPPHFTQGMKAEFSID